MNGLHLLLALTLVVGLATTRPRVTWWSLRIALVLAGATGIHALIA